MEVLTMKKIIAAIILALFVISVVPMALAEEVNENEDQQDQIEDRPLQERHQRTKARIAAQREQLITDKQELQQRAKTLRQNTQERIKQMRVTYKDAKEHYQTARTRFNEHKQDLHALRERLQNCEEDCEQIKQDLRNGASTHLLKALDVMEQNTQRLEAKLVEQDLDTATLSEIKQNIQTQQDALENLGEENQASQLKDIAKQTRLIHKDLKQVHRIVVAQLLHQKITTVIDKHAAISDRMQAKIDKIGGSAELEEIKEKFDQQVAQITDMHQESADLFSEVQSGKEAHDLWHAAHLEVRKELKASKQYLREFMQVYSTLQSENDTQDGEQESEGEQAGEQDENNQ